jgi:hypothetical protein
MGIQKDQHSEGNRSTLDERLATEPINRADSKACLRLSEALTMRIEASTCPAGPAGLAV